MCIDTAPNAQNVQTAENLKERPSFSTRQLSCGHYLGVRQGENSEIQNAVLLKRTEDATGLETCKKIYF